MSPAGRGAAAAPILLLLFLLLTVLVASGNTQGVDTAILATLRQPLHPGDVRGPAWLFNLAAHLTALGALPARAAIGVAAAFVMWRYRQHRAALVLILASLVELPLVEGLKRLFERARPDLAYRLVVVGHASFPSGHATGSMLLYPLAGLLIGRLSGPGGARLGAAVGIALALLIGLNRIMLGVHWTSDVAAGWLLGGSLCLIAAPLATARPPR